MNVATSTIGQIQTETPAQLDLLFQISDTYCSSVKYTSD